MYQKTSNVSTTRPLVEELERAVQPEDRLHARVRDEGVDGARVLLDPAPRFGHPVVLEVAPAPAQREARHRPAVAMAFEHSARSHLQDVRDGTGGHVEREVLIDATPSTSGTHGESPSPTWNSVRPRSTTRPSRRARIAVGPAHARSGRAGRSARNCSLVM